MCAGRLESRERKGANKRRFRSPSGLTAPTKTDYRTVWQEPIYSYGVSYVGEKKRTLTATLKGGFKTCEWFLDGNEQDAKGCRDALIETTLGSHTLKVDTVKSGQILSTAETSIDVRDVLIVALGDSSASGEGVPHLFYFESAAGGFGNDAKQTSPVWWEQRCHRSLFSPAAIAAAELAGAEPQLSVTFVSFACSGADLGTEGMLAPYLGRETVRQVHAWDIHSTNIFSSPNIEPQVMSVTKALCGSDFNATNGGCDSPHRPDYVIISIGVNDLGFGDIVRTLLGSCDAACLKRQAETIDEKLDVLPDRLINLRKAMAPWSPRHVLLSGGNTDRTRQSIGNNRYQYCADTFSFQRNLGFPIAPAFGYALNKVEIWIAYEHVVVPLNDKLQLYAGNNEWRFLDETQPRFLGHGYCSKTSSWFNSYRIRTRAGQYPLRTLRPCPTPRSGELPPGTCTPISSATTTSPRL